MTILWPPLRCSGLPAPRNTNEAVADLDLKPGDDAWAVIKASDVMIGE
jgi:hypothetical protein